MSFLKKIFFSVEHDALLMQHPIGAFAFWVVVFFLSFLLFRFAGAFVFRKISSLPRFQRYILLNDFIQSFHWFFLLLSSVALTIRLLQIHSASLEISYKMFLIVAAIQAVFSIKIFVQKGLNYLSHNIDDPEESSFIQNIGWGVHFFLWIIAVLFLLVNFGYNINSLITGLGVGGIAVAFALQSTLADLFSAFSIYIDQPFKNGDFIVFGEESGTVIKTGFKSTRIRTLRGEELILSNQKIIEAEVKNFHDIQERRVEFSVKISQHTPLEKIQLVKTILENAVQKTNEKTLRTRLDRVHFFELAEYSFRFAVVFYVLTGDYVEYANVMEEINLTIVEEFENSKISFATSVPFFDSKSSIPS